MEISKDKKYSWNSEFRNPIAHSSIEPVIEEIEAIIEIRGSVTPAFLIDSAKNKKSSLHNYFEWDNEKAAHSWRLKQAAKLLGHIEVVVVKDGKPKTIRAYQVTAYNSESGGGEYKRSIDIGSVNVQFIRRMVLADLKRVLNKLSNFDEFKEAHVFVQGAVNSLSKESTETKIEAPTELKAVV